MSIKEVVVQCMHCSKVSVGRIAWRHEPFWDDTYEEVDRELTIYPECLDELELEELQGK
jgi:hypothetical protein